MTNVMRSIAQKLDFGCGVAYSAFVYSMDFEEAATFFGATS